MPGKNRSMGKVAKKMAKKTGNMSKFEKMIEAKKKAKKAKRK